MITTFSTITVAVLFLLLLSLLLWFVVRKKYRRVWFPLLSIFTVQQSRLPRLRLRPPPWLAFLCFLLATSTALLFALQPRHITPLAKEPRQLQLYLFIDFSASLTARTTIAQYRTFLHDVYQRLQAHGELTVGTSHGDKMQKFTDLQTFTAHLQQLDFHRAGLLMSSVMQQQLPQLRDIDRIIVVSDRDKHTWHSFHWQHLPQSLSIHHLEVPQLRQLVSVNLYPHRVLVDNAARFATHRLAVEVAASGNLTAAQNFTITVYHQQQKITQSQASIAAGQQRTLLPLQFPRSKKLNAKSHLYLHLQPETEDAISSDNKFHFSLDSFMPEVAVVADLYGERLLDDPLFQLQTTFAVLGFKIIRMDRVTRYNKQHDLWILAFGNNFTLDQHCPALAPTRQVWLLPQSPTVTTQVACRCYQKLRQQQIRNCTTLQDVLKADKAIKDSHLPLYRQANLTVFTVPLYAQQHTGFDYAAIPVLTQQLLQQQQLSAKHLAMHWPRPADIFSHSATTKPVNVPRGESLLQVLEQAQLPPAAHIDTQGQEITLTSYHTEALPWIQALLLLVILAALIEVVGAITYRRWRAAMEKK